MADEIPVHGRRGEQRRVITHLCVGTVEYEHAVRTKRGAYPVRDARIHATPACERDARLVAAPSAGHGTSL